MQSNLALKARELYALIAAKDCGDNSCLWAQNKKGMRTNGGCRCRVDGTLPSALIKLVPSLVDELEAARIEVDRLGDLCRRQRSAEADTVIALDQVHAELTATCSRLSETERERDETRAALLSVREYLEGTPCSGPCDLYGICNKCSAGSETYVTKVPSLMIALSERDAALEEVRLLRAVLEAASPFLQDHLDDNDCASHKLGRALAAYDAATKGTT
jgi:hypothetical protein